MRPKICVRFVLVPHKPRGRAVILAQPSKPNVVYAFLVAGAGDDEKTVDVDGTLDYVRGMCLFAVDGYRKSLK
jgi:hypothetical protein